MEPEVGALILERLSAIETQIAALPTRDEIQALSDRLGLVEATVAAHQHGIEVWGKTTMPAIDAQIQAAHQRAEHTERRADMRLNILEARVWQVGLAAAGGGAGVGGAVGVVAAVVAALQSLGG